MRHRLIWIGICVVCTALMIYLMTLVVIEYHKPLRHLPEDRYHAR